jgi:hypothetical protein
MPPHAFRRGTRNLPRTGTLLLSNPMLLLRMCDHPYVAM